MTLFTLFVQNTKLSTYGYQRGERESRDKWQLRWERICLQSRRPRFDPWVGKIPWRREWQPNPGFLLGEFHGQRILVSYSPWGHKESDTIEQVTLSHSVQGLDFPALGVRQQLCKHHLCFFKIPEVTAATDQMNSLSVTVSSHIQTGGDYPSLSHRPTFQLPRAQGTCASGVFVLLVLSGSLYTKIHTVGISHSGERSQRSSREPNTTTALHSN